MMIPSSFPSQAQASLADTVAVVVTPGFLTTMESVSTVVLTVAVLGVLVSLSLVLVQLRGMGRSLGAMVRRLEKDSAPFLDRARSVAENVDFITLAVRTDVQKLNASVTSLNQRLMEASNRMEERIQDFTALVEVLQNEAEDLALDTAAAVRGVRAGTKTLAGKKEELEPPETFGPYAFPHPERVDEEVE